MRFWLCLFAVLIFSGTVRGQGDLSKKNRSLYEKAAKAWEARDLDKAYAYYKELLAAEPQLVPAHLRMAQLYEWQKNPGLTKWHYMRAVQLQPASPETLMAYQWLGREAFQHEQYDSAVVYLEEVVRQADGKKNNNLFRLAERTLGSARYASAAVRNPLSISRNPLSDTVNFLPMQFFPVLTADNETLIFTGLTPQGDENIYVSYREDNHWTVPASLSRAINTTGNEGTCSISADGHTLVFTACNRADGHGGCDLYITYKKNKEWTAPVNIGEAVNTRHWESQPALSADGRILYFASDRPGGAGKSDIWKSEKSGDGHWLPPVNLGTVINTPEDENAPFIHANKRALFYASKGHPGMGGFDIFLSQQLDSAWSVPVNLGYPINNSGDQVGMFITSDGRSAYYTEDRRDGDKGRTSKLYRFEIPDTLRKMFAPTRYIKGKVLDRETQAPVSAHIRLYDLKRQVQVSDFVTQEGTGDYLAVISKDSHYALYVESDGYLFKSLTFELTDTSSALVQDIMVERISRHKTEVLNNIYFRSGEYMLDDLSKVELGKLALFLKENAKVTVEISGHTDDIGSSKDNLELSEKRAASVVHYLETSGIEKERLQYKGYGEGQPRAPNDSEENRKLNRRIEWRIL